MNSTRVSIGRSRSPLPGSIVAAAAILALVGLPGCGGSGDGEAAGPGGESAAEVQDSAAEGASVERSPAGFRVTTIEVGGHEVAVEVAESDADRQQGLMGRDSLPPDRGMLFVYSRPQTLSFWMRNTEIPLDIAYISQNGRIVDIQQMEPHTQEQHPSREPAMYALEMNRGWFEEHGVAVGDRVRF